MIVEHQPDGRTLMDRDALAIATGRSRATIRAHCQPAAVRLPHRLDRRKPEYGRIPLYDLAASGELLATIPTRRRPPWTASPSAPPSSTT